MAGKGTARRKEFCFTWDIENYIYLDYGVLESPEFVVDGLKQNKWYVSVYQGKRYVECYLSRNVDCNFLEDIELVYELSLLACDGSEPIRQGETAQFDRESDSYGFEEFAKRDIIFHQKRSAFLPNDTLTVRCRIWKNIGELEEDVFCHARTRIEIERMSFLWVIEQCSTLEPGYGKTYRIKSASERNPIECLNFFFKTGQLCDETMCIQLISSYKNLVTVKILLLDTKGDTKECGLDEFLFDGICQVKEMTLSITRQKLMDEKQLYLTNDALTLHCELAFPIGSMRRQIESIHCGCAPFCPRKQNDHCLDASSVSFNTLKENLNTLHREGFLWNTKLKTSSGTFPVHKTILAARSPVFKAMFTSNAKEQMNNEVDIQDLEGDVVWRMLLYIYTAAVEDLQWKSALTLYIAADKYQILSLKNKCSAFLKASLSPVNACELLVFADMRQDGDLKSYVQDYILRNDRELMNSREWKQLMVDNLQLAAETMHLKFQ